MARVRKLEIKARRLVKESFSGEYHSSFHGQGLDFDDFREYQHGDEVRFIDWNVTARMNTPFIRKFREDRELSVILAVDVSGSSKYGSVERSKRELTAEIAAILGFSALQNGDKFGLFLFANSPILFIPPAKGTRHVLRMVREILASRPDDPRTSIMSACECLVRMLPRRTLVFLISDYLDDPLDRTLGNLARKHETIAIRISDPLESNLPQAGMIAMVDLETGREIVVNTNNANVRMAFKKLTARQREGVENIFRKHGIDYADIQTNMDPLRPLQKLLRRRSRLYAPAR